MTDIPFLETKEFYLREIRASDLDGNWPFWLNDQTVTTLQNKGIIPNTREKQATYFQKMSSSNTDVVLAIIDRKSSKHIGNVGLHNIDWIHRFAEVGIVIGEKNFWGKGYGKKAWNLISRYGFEKLNLHRLYALILKENAPSLNCAESSGFKKEGEIRDYLYKNGNYHTMLYMNALKTDFKILKDI